MAEPTVLEVLKRVDPALVADFWGTGEYQSAIQPAAVALSAHIKSRVSSPLNDRELVAQVFATDPPKSG